MMKNLIQNPIKALLLLLIATTLTTSLFAVISCCMPLFVDPEPVTEGEVRTLLVLSIVHGFYFIMAAVMAMVLPMVIIRKIGAAAMLMPFILKFGLLESAAIFGCVVILLGGLWGVVPAHPLFYLNFGSLVYYLAGLLIMIGKLKAVLTQKGAVTGIPGSDPDPQDRSFINN
jgi:hypothetical protein